MSACLIIAGSIVGLGAVASASQPLLTKKMDEWRLLPRPERTTELYFTDYGRLANSARPDTAQIVTFAVRNSEHQAVTYRYTLSAMSEADMVKHPIGSGTLTLPHDDSLTVNKPVVIPPIDGRIAVNVSLEYQSAAFGNAKTNVQKQSIHYWTEAITAGKAEQKI